jgi:hypothetical protein
MEILDAVLTMVLGIPSGILGVIVGGWFVKKIMFSRDNIMEMIDSALDYAINTVEGQSKVKAVMEKIAADLGKGFGVTTGRGRNPSIKDILIQIGLSYAQSKGWLGTPSEAPQNPQQQSKAPWEH